MGKIFTSHDVTWCPYHNGGAREAHNSPGEEDGSFAYEAEFLIADALEPLLEGLLPSIQL